MRLKTIDFRNAVPVQRFFIDDLSDVVVLAGPNGVGKTRLVEVIMGALQSGQADPSARLVIEATCEDERATWGEERT